MKLVPPTNPQRSGSVNFLYIKRNGLFFVVATKFNVSTLMVIELLIRCYNTVIVHTYVALYAHFVWCGVVCNVWSVPNAVPALIHSNCPLVLYSWTVFPRLAGLFKDYCGVLNEESIRMNFTLVYEILDEVIVSVIIFTLGFFALGVHTVHVCVFRTAGTPKAQPPKH